MANDYKDTMNLPDTKFPMRAGLPVSEPKRLEQWNSMGLYQQMLKRNEGNQTFILHDGPPYANGPIHIGHAFNKILKDIIVKYHSAKGFYSPYVPGWDCHGQPIEHMVETKLGPEKMAAIDQATLRRLCWEWASENIDIQREGFKRLGVLGDWDNPYLTYAPDYEAGNVKVFKDIYLQGAIYRGRKPVHWCRHCHTALAEAEIEYSDESSPSIYVAFDFVDKTSALLPETSTFISLMIWTTTPWTLPANVAVCLSPEADYVAFEVDNKAYIVAEALLPAVVEATGWSGYKILLDAAGETWKAKGSQLTGLEYHHPIHQTLTGVVITGDHVVLDTGTGAVHTAPGHGQEDYVAGELYDLPMLMPVDDNGVFDAGGGPFQGMDVNQADPIIVEWLREQGSLVTSSEIAHSYPHCWRCHNPVIFRATDQWFVSMEKTGMREKAMAELEKLTWYPDWAVRRLGSMIETRPDWCISRQRSWGVPIPVFRCTICNSTVATAETFDAVIELFENEGADAWFTKLPSEYLAADTHCEHCGAGLLNIERERDILDVWWESGVSHTSVLEQRDDLVFPADLYLEGSDQHRGWFQSSLLTSVGAYGVAPYKAIMSCGFVVDEQGRKMSKSLGNGIDPDEVYEEYGADVLRLWVGSVENSQDVSISANITKQLADTYRRIRNSFRFLLSNLEDFNSQTDLVSWDVMLPLDRWAMARLVQLGQTIDAGYQSNRFHLVYRAVYDYIVTDLSAVYLDAIKDRLYSESPKSLARRSAQTVLLNILEMLTRQLSPILSYTCDEVWEYYPESIREADRPQSVFLAGWPEPDDFVPSPPAAEAEELLADFKVVLLARDAVTKALEEARSAGLINKSQEASIVLTLPQKQLEILSTLPAETLEELLIVSTVELIAGDDEGVTLVDVKQASGDKCPRCWNVRELGGNEAYPDLCPRCAEVLLELSGDEPELAGIGE
ncbi:MAG: isoleucine--tRNA ligase [Coriobacteriia bacterium]|nr:isoleucine--tRNA ligase [Coriobacteriia bacterium]